MQKTSNPLVCSLFFIVCFLHFFEGGIKSNFKRPFKRRVVFKLWPICRRWDSQCTWNLERTAWINSNTDVMTPDDQAVINTYETCGRDVKLLGVCWWRMLVGINVRECLFRAPYFKLKWFRYLRTFYWWKTNQGSMVFIFPCQHRLHSYSRCSVEEEGRDIVYHPSSSFSPSLPE